MGGLLFLCLDCLVIGHFVSRSFRTQVISYQFGQFVPTFFFFFFFFFSFCTEFVFSYLYFSFIYETYLVISYLVLMFRTQVISYPKSLFRTHFSHFVPISFRTYFKSRYEMTEVLSLGYHIRRLYAVQIMGLYCRKEITHFDVLFLFRKKKSRFMTASDNTLLIYMYIKIQNIHQTIRCLH